MEPVVQNSPSCSRCGDLPIDAVARLLCLCQLEVASPLVAVMFGPEPEDRRARVAALNMKLRVAHGSARRCDRDVKREERRDPEAAKRVEASGRRWRFAAAQVQAQLRRLTHRPGFKKATPKRKVARRVVIVRRAARARRTARRRAASRRVQVDTGGDPPPGPSTTPDAAGGVP